MSKLSKTLACATLAAGLALALQARAQARNHAGDTAEKTFPPSHYMPPPVVSPPRHCRWGTERYRYKGHWHWRRVWRCW